MRRTSSAGAGRDVPARQPDLLTTGPGTAREDLLAGGASRTC